MDEYLSVLLPALTDRKVSFTGDIWSAETDGVGRHAGVEPPTVMLAAMGPRMLQLAGERTAGSILWLSGPKAIAEQIKPALDARRRRRRAAGAAHRGQRAGVRHQGRRRREGLRRRRCSPATTTCRPTAA